MEWALREPANEMLPLGIKLVSGLLGQTAWGCHFYSSNVGNFIQPSPYCSEAIFMGSPVVSTCCLMTEKVHGRVPGPLHWLVCKVEPFLSWCCFTDFLNDSPAAQPAKRNLYLHWAHQPLGRMAVSGNCSHQQREADRECDRVASSPQEKWFLFISLLTGIVHVLSLHLSRTETLSIWKDLGANGRLIV